jgi:uncharacterized membrane protein
MGRDPWMPVFGNAYGPLYNLIAYLYDFEKYLPKLLFVFVWFTCAFGLIRGALLAHLPAKQCRLMTGVLVSPLFFIQVALFGTFDVLVGFFCLLALWSATRDRQLWAGAALSTAVFLKFYPVVLLPALVVTSTKKQVVRLAIGFVAVGSAVMAFTLRAWGTSFLEPLIFAEDRDAKGASIFRYLDGDYSPLRILDLSVNVSRSSHIVLVIAFSVCLFAIYRLKIHRSVACVFALLVTLMFYRVGHSQFQIPLILLMMYMLIDQPLAVRSRTFMRRMIIYIGFYNVLAVGYVVTGYLEGALDNGYSGSWEFVRDLSGLPAFIFAGALALAILREPNFRRTDLDEPQTV